VLPQNLEALAKLVIASKAFENQQTSQVTTGITANLYGGARKRLRDPL